MDNNFSQRVRNIMAYSREEAGRLQNNYIGPEHLMLGILRDGEGMAIQVLQDFDIDLHVLKDYIDSHIRSIQEPYEGSNELVINKNTEKALKISILEARLTKSDVTDSEHILLALLKEKSTLIYDILTQFQLDYSSAFLYIKSILENRTEEADDLNLPSAGANFTDDDDDDMSDKSSFNPGGSHSSSSQSKGAVSDTPPCWIISEPTLRGQHLKIALIQLWAAKRD